MAAIVFGKKKKKKEQEEEKEEERNTATKKIETHIITTCLKYELFY